MSKIIYVIQLTDRERYRQLGKGGHKMAEMSFYVESTPVYGIAKQAEAIAECIKLNRSTTTDSVYYYQKIKIY